MNTKDFNTIGTSVSQYQSTMQMKNGENNITYQTPIETNIVAGVTNIQEPSRKIKGSNNGTWGLGMSRGAMFPPSMNGPLGYINHPLPYDDQSPSLLNGPRYNAPRYNGPAYNQPAFYSISGFTFDGKFNNPAPIGDNAGVLLFEPDLS